MKTEFQTGTLILVLGIVLCLALLSALLPGIVSSYDPENVTTLVNITNSAPFITRVTIDENVGAFATLTLSQGGTRQILCNVTVTDYNSVADIANVNATFFHSSVTVTDPNDNNNHYTNDTCSQVADDGLNTANYTCIFDVFYYANNGTWTCNASTIDQQAFTGSLSNTSTIDPLYAINVTPTIDYGNMAVGDISNNETLNITNFGNRDINITVLGYGEAELDDLSMVCDYGNISIGNQHFSLTPVDFGSKQVLATTATQVTALTVIQQTNDSMAVTNTTYWQLEIPLDENPAGQCNGTVVVEAIAP
ncbi:MAG: hypothetical protein ABIA93_04140 [Candidatus Woesearchaeota archaeon]